MPTYQAITPATLATIVAATTNLPPEVLPLAKVIAHSTDDRHLPTNLRHGLQSLFTDRPIDWTDPVYGALRDLITIATSERSPEVLSRAPAALRELRESGNWQTAQLAMDWFNEVVQHCAADGVAKH